MKKGILISIIALVTLSLTGCSVVSRITGSSSGGPEIVKKADLGTKWTMRQISLELGAGSQMPVLLKLADGDKVDGFFYLEKGNNVDFQIAANSLIYKPSIQDAYARGITSDRFSFTASQAQGATYTLMFRNTSYSNDKVTVFLEIIYPATGSVFTLLDNAATTTPTVPTGPTAPAAPTAGASLVLGSASGVAGSVISVTGSGLPVSTYGLVFFDVNRNGACDPGEPVQYLTTTASGTISTSLTAPAAAPGVYLILAFFGPNTPQASANFVISQ